MTITVDDHLAILTLVAEYNRTTDNADADAFMQCWVSPEEFGGYDSAAFGSMATWDDLYAFEKEHVGPGGMANGKRHQATNIVIEPAGDSEALVSHDMLVIEVADVPGIIATGRYDKSLVVKTPDGWRFKSRTLTVDDGFFVLTGQTH